MTKEQLTKANNIQHQIGDISHSISYKRRCLKELELSSYQSESTKLRLEHTDCIINTKELIKFLNSELKRELAIEEELNKKFEKI